ncbi:hypothetical protein RchiOBHm_Chr2g0117301 [Rosa chinensis]|uniref:Uncharacterized protein n=1 Tax=Rosa chinensis TaxID=74649 RepID=A0A2P6RRG3_ROSCH|nr:hypothetical protein RchiOBHm_Chr2g0117301 [Rosa chinensis]
MGLQLFALLFLYFLFFFFKNGSANQYKGIVDCVQTIVREEGPPTLLKRNISSLLARKRGTVLGRCDMIAYVGSVDGTNKYIFERARCEELKKSRRKAMEAIENEEEEEREREKLIIGNSR